jgi:hypothetical protein
MLATLLFDFGQGLEPFRVEVIGSQDGLLIGRPVDVEGDDVLFDEKDVAWVGSERVRMGGMFDIWAKKEGPAPEPEPPPRPPPPPPQEMTVIPGERPAVLYLPYTPRGVIPAPEMPLSEFKGEGALPPAPVQNPFAVWNPETPKEAKKESKFEMFRPEAPGLPAQVEKEAGAFSIWKPPPGQEPIVAPPPVPSEPSIFSTWNPEVMAAEAAAMREKPLWEAMVPQEEQGAMYRPEPEIFKPEQTPEAAVEKSQERARRKPKAAPWTAPSVEWMAKTLGEVFDLPKLWKMIRKDRKSEWFKEGQAEAIEGIGEGPIPIPIQTTINYEEGNTGHWTEELFKFFDMDPAPLEGLLEKYYEDEDEEANEELSEIGHEIRSLISDAFDTLQPDDLPGVFGITEHSNFGNQEFIGYIEEPEDTLSPDEVRRIKLEREEEERHVREKQERQVRKALGGWSIPSWEEMAAFLDVQFGIQNLVETIRKARTRKKWRDELRESGWAQLTIVSFGRDDGELEDRLAELFGIPKNVISRILDEYGPELLWNWVFYPTFERLEEAWDNVKPSDIPGKFLVTEDESDEFVLYYEEEAEYTEEEE